MNKKLPNVYAVPITKKIENNKETFRSSKEVEVRSEKISKNEINKIFNSKEHVYKTRVSIKTNMGVKEVEVVGLTNDSLLTLQGEKINIDDILEIKKM